MKKVFVFAAAAALLLITACNEVSNPAIEQMDEISVVNAASVTKGYVEGATFVDSPYDKLHGQTPDGKTDRNMYLSAYLTPKGTQSFASANYFVNQLFSKNANGETDNMWHHNPKIYWPLGGQLDFLAFSSTIDFSGTALNWDNGNAASKCVLYVSEDYLQDDILFAYAASQTSNNGTPTAMNFNHTQAWIEFQINVDNDDMKDVVKVEDIIIKDLQTRGELTLTGGATPACSWNFTSETARDRAMDDTYGILASATGSPFINDVKNPATGTGTWAYMDMLIPAQQPQSSFLVHYTLAGQPAVLEYCYDLPNAYWEAGKKYIYQITFKPYEIIINPDVVPFDTVDPGHSSFPSTID